MRNRFLLVAAVAFVLAGPAPAGAQAAAKAKTAPARANAEQQLLDGFRKATVASVADAVDQVVGKRGYMSHDMRPRVPGRIVGRAVTAYLVPAPPEKSTPALSTGHSVGIIDNSKPGEVAVIVLKDGLDVAGLGGLMGTSAKVRGMAGVIVDGGARDIAELRALGLPTFSRSVVPSSTVGRWAGVSSNQPVECAGVTVNPGDIIVADEDGVVAVPKDRAAEVLKKSQDIDQLETKMVPLIKENKALSAAREKFNRI